MLRVYLTGELMVESGTAVLRESALPARQGRLLLARLALERTYPAPREELADLLWPGHAPPSWDLALNALVSKLRSALAGLPGLTRDSITQAFGCYQLRLPAGAWIDVEEAQSSLHLAEAALQLSRPEDAYPHAVVANAITSRAFLVGESGDWANARREELAVLRVRTLDCLADCLSANGETSLAIQDAEEALRLDPYREAGYRRLMRIHQGAGDRAQALRVYERCRRLLADELGVSPSAETERLYRGLLN